MKFAEEKRASVVSGGRPCLEGLLVNDGDVVLGEVFATARDQPMPGDVRALRPGGRLHRPQCRPTLVDETTLGRQVKPYSGT